MVDHPASLCQRVESGGPECQCLVLPGSGLLGVPKTDQYEVSLT
jgi:hypothetical protein